MSLPELVTWSVPAALHIAAVASAGSLRGPQTSGSRVDVIEFGLQGERRRVLARTRFPPVWRPGHLIRYGGVTWGGHFVAGRLSLFGGLDGELAELLAQGRPA